MWACHVSVCGVALSPDAVIGSLVPRLPRLTAKGSLVFLLRFPGTGSQVITLISCDLINYNKRGHHQYELHLSTVQCSRISKE